MTIIYYLLKMVMFILYYLYSNTTYRKLTQQELTQEQSEKPSIHDSLGKHAGQQAAHSDKPKMKKEQTR